jgi:hypothetical protein
MKTFNSEIPQEIPRFDLLRLVVWSSLIGYAVTAVMWTGVNVLRLIF